ncbi:hypothetical protein [Shewanella algae]|uniref:hypothetical protein n=1 Tax=Shewanella algae TaxID=38313 RepID=UPI0031F56097
MSSKRFLLALEMLKPSDWLDFERLASIFLASMFDDIRVTANSSGDKGRDAELFSPYKEPKVMIQYSVTAEWSAKIKHTIERLKTTFPDANYLVYVTNQEIGAKGDTLKATVRKEGIFLDILDRNWFVDKQTASKSMESAAEELAEKIVDPFLSKKEVAKVLPSELSSQESMAAITYLNLQWQDDNRDKGLTKLVFEAVVRAALIGTSQEKRLTRQEIYKKVGDLLSNHKEETIEKFVNTALARLSKSTIKHWKAQDEFHLSHEETTKYQEFKANSLLSESTLNNALDTIIADTLGEEKSLSDDNKNTLRESLRNLTTNVLFERSQAFAIAVHSGQLSSLADSDFAPAILKELNQIDLPNVKGMDWRVFFRKGIREILTTQDRVILEYLRSLSDSYTLLAFLQQTPDVQRVVEKMFAFGNVWLDTTILLPLISDTLLIADGLEIGRFTRMINAAKDIGLKLYVTPGVIEELERHMNRAKTCAQMQNGHWNGSIPFLLEKYISSGRSKNTFASWLENFRGEMRAEEDISIYLREEFQINTRSLEDESNRASEELRHALEQIWHERYKYREQKYGTILDENAVTRLISHDVECYTGVLELRRQQKESPFGYTDWWLTVDKQTFDLKEKLQRRMIGQVPDSPVLSADFLVNYLAFGPLRGKIVKETESRLPLLMILGNTSYLTPELMHEAESMRENLKDLSERVIRRQVRDKLDQAKAKIGPISMQGLSTVNSDELEDSLQLDATG